jgi:MFS family permease
VAGLARQSHWQLVQTVGGQWLLVDEPHASILVGLVQTATALPFVLLGLPAGVLADILDRRRLLIAVQTVMAAIGVLLAVLTFPGPDASGAVAGS